MMTWQLQEAKNRFSAVVDAAVRGQPQQVTRRGKPVVVVVSAEMYKRFSRMAEEGLPRFNEVLLGIPQDDGEFERAPFRPRDTDLPCT